MLVRKNIMIEDLDWKALEILQDIKKNNDKKISISKIANEAVKNYIESEKEKNLAFKMKMLSTSMNKAEEEEILKELLDMGKEDLEIARIIDIT